MNSKFEMYTWRAHPEYFDEIDGKIVFKDDTPEEILESYRMYQTQIESLEAFPNKPTSGLLSFFNHQKKEKKSSSNVELAQKFVQYRCIGRDIPHTWVEFDVEYHDAFGHVYTSVEAFPKMDANEYRITDSVQKGNKIIIFWKIKGYHMSTIFAFRGNKIGKIREYASLL